MLIQVALFARAWIEMSFIMRSRFVSEVALFARAWIEINPKGYKLRNYPVALFARAWIEIRFIVYIITGFCGRPLCEGVD